MKACCLFNCGAVAAEAIVETATGGAGAGVWLIDMAFGKVIILLPIVQLFVLIRDALGCILTIFVFAGSLITMQLFGNIFRMLLLLLLLELLLAATFGSVFDDCRMFLLCILLGLRMFRRLAGDVFETGFNGILLFFTGITVKQKCILHYIFNTI